jgi:hypothetical protein
MSAMKQRQTRREKGTEYYNRSPQTINALGALRAHLSEDVKAGLSTESLRYRQPVTHLTSRYDI